MKPRLLLLEVEGLVVAGVVLPCLPTPLVLMKAAGCTRRVAVVEARTNRRVLALTSNAHQTVAERGDMWDSHGGHGHARVLADGGEEISSS